MADFTPYYDVMRKLGVDSKNIEDVLGFQSGKEVLSNLGASLHSTDLGKDIVKVVDETLSEYNLAKGKPVGHNYNADKNRKTAEILELYDFMKTFITDIPTRTELKNLDALTIDKL